METELAAKAINFYGLKPQKLAPAVTGYRNRSFYFETAEGAKMNLILYKREPGILARIKNANYVANYLAASGILVRRSADSRILKLASGKALAYGALYNWLPGETIPWEAYTMKHLKNLGMTLGKMHSELETQEKASLPLATDELLEFATRMEAYFVQSGVNSALKRKLNLQVNLDLAADTKLLEELALATHQQPLHLDFVRGNILFAKKSTEVVGIIDFEKAAYGAPVIDVARTLAFLLVDCKYKQPDKIRKYFLASGYLKRGSGKIDSPEILEKLVEFFWVYDFYKFLRHNPYEYLHQNEHFKRTRDRLLAAGKLKKC